MRALRRVCQQGVEQADRARLVQWLVAVAAFGGLDARRAPLLALTVRDGVPSCAEPLEGPAVAALSKAGAAGVPVVDEDRGHPGVGVPVGRHAADIPPVRGGEERQHPDGGVVAAIMVTEGSTVLAGDVILCMGAGSIGAVPGKVVELLQQNEQSMQEGRGL